MKRKAESQLIGQNGKGILKKRSKTVLSDEESQASFRPGLFAKDVLSTYTQDYASSQPYKHGVIDSLVDDTLLRSVRNEIRENVHFTPKETDIYKIHQSGDLANLDGLEDAALEKLPSLLRLRDALYSDPFRKYVAGITGSGELSGRKTDMAINVYTPGCHLLCHDDVIGSRRVSYILYLTDPDTPWKEEWGGALRLYPTQTFQEDNGETTKTPTPEFTKVIPPAWNQLSFFAVQPGESFHDVEEVYHAATQEQLGKDAGRIRMAISGWYHIPQIGEPGYVKGAEEKWGANSSLLQLQGHPDRYDYPQESHIIVEVPESAPEEKSFNETDLDFLLKYMAPTYLTPDTIEQVKERFMDLSSVTLDSLLSKSYAARVREYIENQGTKELPKNPTETEAGPWKVAKPPHKHRFLYQQPSEASNDETTDLDPITEILEVFLPSSQFKKWLEMATECEVENYDILARRFRRGLDYALAKSHDGSPRLEISLGLTPSPGWAPEEAEDQEDDATPNEAKKTNGSSKQGEEAMPNGAKETNGNAKNDANPSTAAGPSEDFEDVGGHEVYMAGDDDEAAGDAAVYKTSAEDDDDNVLFSMPASWNNMSIVLRDSGVLKFVKYVSKNAKGDRWDISGSFGVKVLEGDDEDDEEDGEEGNSSLEQMVALESSEEEEFNGFPDSSDGESD